MKTHINLNSLLNAIFFLALFSLAPACAPDVWPDPTTGLSYIYVKKVWTDPVTGATFIQSKEQGEVVFRVSPPKKDEPVLFGGHFKSHLECDFRIMNDTLIKSLKDIEKYLKDNPYGTITLSMRGRKCLSDEIQFIRPNLPRSVLLAEGECTVGDCKNGYGKLRDLDGNIWKGTWIDGNLSGTATITTAKGTEYKATYEMGTLAQLIRIERIGDGPFGELISKYEILYINQSKVYKIKTNNVSFIVFNDVPVSNILLMSYDELKRTYFPGPIKKGWKHYSLTSPNIPANLGSASFATYTINIEDGTEKYLEKIQYFISKNDTEPFYVFNNNLNTNTIVDANGKITGAGHLRNAKGELIFNGGLKENKYDGLCYLNGDYLNRSLSSGTIQFFSNGDTGMVSGTYRFVPQESAKYMDFQGELGNDGLSFENFTLVLRSKAQEILRPRLEKILEKDNEMNARLNNAFSSLSSNYPEISQQMVETGVSTISHLVPFSKSLLFNLTVIEYYTFYIFVPSEYANDVSILAVAEVNSPTVKGTVPVPLGDSRTITFDDKVTAFKFIVGFSNLPGAPCCAKVNVTASRTKTQEIIPVKFIIKRGTN